jgi:hypothetical protein
MRINVCDTTINSHYIVYSISDRRHMSSFLKRLFGKKTPEKSHIAMAELNGMIYYDYLSFDELVDVVEYYEPHMSTPIPIPDGRVIPLLQKEYNAFSSKKQKSFMKVVGLITQTCRTEITPSYLQTLVMQYKDADSKYFVVFKKNPNHTFDIVSLALIHYDPTLIAEELEDIHDILKDIKPSEYPPLVYDLYSEMNINTIPKEKRNLDAEGDEDDIEDNEERVNDDDDVEDDDDNLHQYDADIFVVHMFCAVKDTAVHPSISRPCEQLPYISYGFGTTLIKHIENYLLSNFKPRYNKKSMLLLIDRPLTNAIPFYEKNGYMLDQQEVTVMDSKGKQKTEIINTLLTDSMFKFLPLTPVKRKINRRVERMTKFITQNAPYIPHLIPSEVVHCFQALQLIPDEEVLNISYNVLLHIADRQTMSLNKIKEWYQSDIPVIVRDGMLCSLIALYNIDCAITRIPFEINRKSLEDFIYRRIESYIYFKTTNNAVTSGLIAYRPLNNLPGLVSNDDVFVIDIASFASSDTKGIESILPIVATNMRGITRSTSRYTLFKIPYDDGVRDTNYAKYRTVLNNLGFQTIEGHTEKYLAFDTSGNKVDVNTLFQKDVTSSQMGGKPKSHRSLRVTRRVSRRLSKRSSMRRRLKK